MFRKNGSFKGKGLGELWESHRELFGHLPGKKFPLLTKILDARFDLSVQVHPDDAYAMKYEHGEFGKTECWYVIDCKENAELILGHHAKTKEELEKWLKEGVWEKFIRKIPIKPGHFIYVPSGTIHAICEGTVILETQQNSDVTYRVYDYDRTDDKGNKRELHIQQSIDVTTVPHVDVPLNQHKIKKRDGEIITFVENEFFTVKKINVHGEMNIEQNKPFMLVSVIEGKGEVNGMFIQKGVHVMIPYGMESVTVKGKLEIILAHV